MVEEAEGLTLRFGLRAGVGGRFGLLGGTKEMPGAFGLARGMIRTIRQKVGLVEGGAHWFLQRPCSLRMENVFDAGFSMMYEGVVRV